MRYSMHPLHPLCSLHSLRTLRSPRALRSFVGCLVGCFVGCVVLASTCLAQAPGWVQVTTQNTPAGRWSHGMAYDLIRGRTVIFGGTTASSNYVNDTWEYDGNNWTQMQPQTVPPARRLTGMAFQFLPRLKMVMFGGLASTGVLGDTWEWDGKDWTLLKPQSSPSARRSGALAYDTARQRTVLFGGHDGSAYVNDTWEWDGTSWTQIKTQNAPTGRYTNMVYDSARQRIVIHSGFPGYYGDTWEYDGKDWTQVKTNTVPTGRCCAGVAYDMARQRMVMFGGYSGAYRQETWEYDGKDWTLLTLSVQPVARYGGDFMAYDQRRSRVVIFGGLTQGSPRQAADTWEFVPSLVGSPSTISIASGGTHAFALDAGTTNGNRSYWIFGSVTGTSPGVTLGSAVGPVTIPLVPDVYTNLTIALANISPFVSTRGTLDAAGKNANGKLVVPVISDQGLIGLTLYHAGLVYDSSNNYYLATNPVSVQLVK